MPELVVQRDGRRVATDRHGYLKHWRDWDEGLAEQMAAADGIDLSEAHWEILRFLRDYYDEFQMAPPIRLLLKAVAARLGTDKGNSRYLYRLFPEGPAKQACRYAGLPKPVSCI